MSVGFKSINSSALVVYKQNNKGKYRSLLGKFEIIRILLGVLSDFRCGLCVKVFQRRKRQVGR